MDSENQNSPMNWKPKEKSFKSIGAEGQVETTIYEVEARRRISIDRILRGAGLIALITPFLLLYIQRCTEIESDRREKLSDSYIQFSRDFASVMGKNHVDSNYRKSIENLKFSYKAKFKLFGSKSLNLYSDSVLFYISLRDAVIKLTAISDSLLTISDQELINTGAAYSSIFRKYSKFFKIPGFGELKIFYPQSPIDSVDIRPMIDSILRRLLLYYNEAASIYDEIRSWPRGKNNLIDKMLNNNMLNRDVEDLVFFKLFLQRDSIFEKTSEKQLDSIFSKTFQISDALVQQNKQIIASANVIAIESDNDEKFLSFKEPMRYINITQEFQMTYLRRRLNQLQGHLDSLVIKQIGR